MAAYSTRARANAPVSAPVAWEELSRDLRFDRFNVGNMPKRLQKAKTDPWQHIAEAALPLNPAMMARVGFKPR